METIGQIVAPPQLHGCFNEFAGHGLHGIIRPGPSRMVEEHDKAKHLPVGVAKEGVLVLLDTAYGDVEKVGPVFEDDAAGGMNEGISTFRGNKVFMEDVSAEGGAVAVDLDTFIKELVA